MTVNGPEDEGLDWDQIIWPVHEEHVRRLRRRISLQRSWLGRFTNLITNHSAAPQ